MRRSIEEYIRKCNSCQRRKEDREFLVPLGQPEEPTGPFDVTSMDLTGPYPQTERKNKYLLTFIDHFTQYAEAFPVEDQMAKTCARVFATQIITLHGTVSKLITDQGPAFMSTFPAKRVRYWEFKRFELRATTPSQTVRWKGSIDLCTRHCPTTSTPQIKIGTY